MTRRIGIDFDNTLICYDRLFLLLAREAGYEVPTKLRDKTALRDWLRVQPEGELAWQRLQAQAYGPQIGAATLFNGVEEVLAACQKRGDQLYVVSHKSRFAAQDREGVNLHQAARKFLVRSSLFERRLLNPDQVFFEESRAEKVRRIASLGCELFIDDLPETFTERDFPTSIRRILFAAQPLLPGIECCRNWQEIGQALE